MKKDQVPPRGLAPEKQVPKIQNKIQETNKNALQRFRKNSEANYVRKKYSHARTESLKNSFRQMSQQSITLRREELQRQRELQREIQRERQQEEKRLRQQLEKRLRQEMERKHRQDMERQSQKQRQRQRQRERQAMFKIIPKLQKDIQKAEKQLERHQQKMLSLQSSIKTVSQKMIIAIEKGDQNVAKAKLYLVLINSYQTQLSYCHQSIMQRKKEIIRLNEQLYKLMISKQI